jgi:hypothetical protein
VDGKAVKPTATGGNRWAIAVNRDSFVAALFQEPPTGFASVATSPILCRCVDRVTRRDILRPSFLAGAVTALNNGVRIEPMQQKVGSIQSESQVHIPLKAPASGILRISTAEVPPPACRLNGNATAFVSSTAANQKKVDSMEIPMQSGEAALLSLSPTVAGTFNFEWLPRNP